MGYHLHRTVNSLKMKKAPADSIIPFHFCPLEREPTCHKHIQPKRAGQEVAFKSYHEKRGMQQHNAGIGS